MLTHLLEETIDDVASEKRLRQRYHIIKILFTSNKGMTIPEIASISDNSIPTVTHLVMALIQEDWVVDIGKKHTDFGRKPTLYALNKEKFYVLGLRIGLKGRHLVVNRLDSSTKQEFLDHGFVLKNSQQCLDDLVHYIRKAIGEAKLQMGQILGLGIGITGRVNRSTGESLNYFNFMDMPLRQYLEAMLGITVLVDNDTRVIGISERELGKGKGAANALFVNVGRGLGLGMVVNGQTVTGNLGFAGEFGHMQLGNKGRPCLCGKRSCLGTEVSGHALQEDLKEALEHGKSSVFLHPDASGEYDYRDILAASKKGDVLAIELVQEQGKKLGEALGNVLNLLNPELVVICGEMVKVKEIFLDSVKMGLKRTALVNVLSQCEITTSTFDNHVLATGAASMVLKHYDLI